MVSVSKQLITLIRKNNKFDKIAGLSEAPAASLKDEAISALVSWSAPGLS